MINRINPDFNPDLAFQYQLSILLRQDGFSFIVTLCSSSRVLVFYDIDTKISNSHESLWPKDLALYLQALKSYELLTLSYASIAIAISSERFLMAPQQYAEEEYKANLFSVMYQPLHSDIILSDAIMDKGPVCLALVPKEIVEFCHVYWPKAVIECATVVNIKGIMRTFSQLIKRQIFVQVATGNIEIIIIQGLRLLYINSFRYKTGEDILYYLLFVLEQLGFSHTDEELVLLGQVVEDSDLVKQLKLYFLSLTFAKEVETSINDDLTSAGIFFHQHFTLLHLSLCE